MRKFQFMMAAIAAIITITSCTSEDIEMPKENVRIALNVTKEGTTKAIQSSFLSGNTVLVFFNGDLKNGTCQSDIENGHYLKMSYDGTAWTYDISSDYLDALPSSGTMDAIYVSNYDACGFYTYDGGLASDIRITTVLNNKEACCNSVDYLIAEGQTYTIEDGELKGTIALARKKSNSTSSTYYQINLQVSVSGLEEGEWYLKSSLAISRNIRYVNNTDGAACQIDYSNYITGRYAKMSTVGDDKVAYFGKDFMRDLTDYTFYLYNNTTGETYSRTINSGGLGSSPSSLYDLWVGSDGQTYQDLNTALKMPFSSFTKED